ncbi:MAG: DUF4340 domain-containing protein [Gammaproteobacteria bacterium]|nr:DUF4340 domain-containing protein [Gammaproteobacteria bacterium]
MTTRTWLNLALLGGVALLVLVVVYQPGLHTAQPLPRLTALVPANITHLRIERDGAAPIALERKAQDWIMTAPVRMPANTFRVETVLQVAQAESHARMDAATVRLAEFKLDKPRVQLWFDATEIAFGATEPLNGRRYVRLGDSVHLISDTVYFDLIGEFTAFADSALLAPQSQNRLTQLDLPALRLVRVGEGGWMQAPNRMHAPPEPEVSMDRVNALLDAWRRARAIQVRPYVTPVSAGAEPENVIFIHLEDAEQPLRFDIVSRTPDLVLARADLGVQYHFPAGAIRKLFSLAVP